MTSKNRRGTSQGAVSGTSQSRQEFDGLGLEGQPRFLKTLTSSVTTAWGVDWDEVYIARDLMQNFFDANRGRVSEIRVDANGWDVVISADTLQPGAVVLSGVREGRVRCGPVRRGVQGGGHVPAEGPQGHAHRPVWDGSPAPPHRGYGSAGDGTLSRPIRLLPHRRGIRGNSPDLARQLQETRQGVPGWPDALLL